jgi:glyoxylase-like metal-dependent hydrolase (beta-lactamase superfamily II)
MRTSLLAPVAVLLAAVAPASAQQATTRAAVRLYVLDCGSLESGDPSRYNLKREEMATTTMSVACYLIVHPRGTLMWDVGAVPDREVAPGAGAVRHHLVLPNGQDRFVTIRKSLAAQLAEAGYKAADITFLALSHYHYDHTANANHFAGATWLARAAERNVMLLDKPPGLLQPSSYSALKTSATVVLTGEDHDVFGDGTVVLKPTPGHTPGHQVLFVRLANTGPVVLSGDLYHYPEERTLNRIPTFEEDAEQTRTSRTSLDAFMKAAGAQLWIQHDFQADAKLRKAPAYYD